MKSYLKKLEYSFLVKSNKIESVSFSYKTAISKANVKTNRMVSTKMDLSQERGFASNFFIFFLNLCQFKNLL